MLYLSLMKYKHSYLVSIQYLGFRFHGWQKQPDVKTLHLMVDRTLNYILEVKRFKSLTNGHHIIMGRKTFESFPKPLPNRTHVVISRQQDYKVPNGVILVNSLEDAIDASKNDLQPFIIGGGEIYKQAMLIADKIELTRVHESFEADTFFPEIDTSVWKETANTFHKKDENHKYEFSFLTYERV